HVDAQTLEARVARLQDPLGPPVDALRAVRLARVSELRRQHDPIAPAAEGLGQQRLVLAPPVRVRGVQEIHAEVDRALNDADRLRVVARAVHARHRHAPEPDRADLQRAATQPPLIDHGSGLRGVACPADGNTTYSDAMLELRPSPAARVARGHDLLVRVHLLRAVRARHAPQRVPELRRRAVSAPRASPGATVEVAALDDARGETTGRGPARRVPYALS